MIRKNDEIIKDVANSFVKLLSSYKDEKMQRVKFSERLKRLDTGTIVELLHFFVIQSQQNVHKFKPLMNCLMDIPHLVAVLGNERMSDIYNMLDEKGYHSVRSLLAPHPHRTRRAYEDDILPFPDMESIPLGLKKTLAKSRQKHLLDKLVYEEDPIIIRNLLNNTQVTERDVLKIITRRPIRKQIIQEVLNSKKWIDRYTVKKAIIRNPYTPTDIALNLLHYMLLQDIRVIAQDAGLHFLVRDTAAKLIANRKENDEAAVE